MFTDNDKNLIMDMLERMYHYDNFKAFLDDPSESEWYNCLDIQDELDISMHCGATKGVIVMDDCNFVIKLPFDTHDFDYCMAEWRNYLMAQQEGLEECFAETHYVGVFHGICVYAQEYLDCDESATSEQMWNSSYRAWLNYTGKEDNDENRDDFASDFDYEDSKYYDMCVEEWGVATTNKFVEFCDGNYISDLHSGNWSAGSCLKAVDFSGFGEISSYFQSNYYDGNQWEDTSDRAYNWFRICDLAIAFNAA